MRSAVLRTARGPVATLQAGPPDGVPVVLMPGWTGTAQHLVPLLAHLADQGRRAVTVDQRGWDETLGPPERSSAGVAALAADLLAVVDALGGSAHLLGLRRGAQVATEAALVRPEAVASLTLVCSGPQTLPTDQLARRPVPVLVLAAGPSPAADDPATTAALLGDFLDRWPTPRVVLDLRVDSDTREVPAARHRVRALTAAGTLPAALLDDLELVVTELLTNALLHGSAPARLRLLVWPVHDPVVQVEVCDAGSRRGSEPHDARPDHGRGLTLVHALSRRSGCYTDSQGYHGWAELCAHPGTRAPRPAAGLGSAGSSASHGDAASLAAAPSGKGAVDGPAQAQVRPRAAWWPESAR